MKERFYNSEVLETHPTYEFQCLLDFSIAPLQKEWPAKYCCRRRSLECQLANLKICCEAQVTWPSYGSRSMVPRPRRITTCGGVLRPLCRDAGIWLKRATKKTWNILQSCVVVNVSSCLWGLNNGNKKSNSRLNDPLSLESHLKCPNSVRRAVAVEARDCIFQGGSHRIAFACWKETDKTHKLLQNSWIQWLPQRHVPLPIEKAFCVPTKNMAD